MELHELTKKQLFALRKEVVLNSLFTRDFENSFGISPTDCQAFFDGYVEYLWELATSELDYRGTDIMWVFEKLDNKENLCSWFEIFKGGI